MSNGKQGIIKAIILSLCMAVTLTACAPAGEFIWRMRESIHDGKQNRRTVQPLAGFNTIDTVLDDIEEIWAKSNVKHYTELLPTYKKNANWKCKICGGVYSAPVDEFIEKHLKSEDDCPFYNGRKPLAGFNTLKAVNPPWFSEWSYQNNYLICDPDEILPHYGNDVWWECNRCHHDFKMSPKERGFYEKRHKTACPYCKGLRRKKRYFF